MKKKHKVNKKTFNQLKLKVILLDIFKKKLLLNLFEAKQTFLVFKNWFKFKIKIDL